MGVAMTAAAFQVDEPSALRRELAEGIKAAWHKSCEHVLRIGRLLIEAKDKLAHGEFTQMILEDMPFGPRQAQTFMELARPRDFQMRRILRFCRSGRPRSKPSTVSPMANTRRLASTASSART
jgi:hypothetical protein